MNHEFCMECGHKNLFEVSRPKFCAGCGNGLNSTAKASVKKTSSVQEEDKGDGFDAGSLDLDKLRRQISIEGSSRKVSLDDLWSAPAPNDGIMRAASSSLDGKELLKSIREECAPIHSAKEIDG